MIDAPRSAYPMPPDDAPAGTDLAHSETPLPRLRAVTNSPAQEYAQRAGEVECLPDSVAALILCRKGRSLVERQQIKVTLDGEDLYFTSPNSIMIAAKNGTGERVVWALNRRFPDVLHLLTDDGCYIESVPRKGDALWFSRDEASQTAYGDAQRMIQRDLTRLQELHQPDTAAAAADAAHNAAQVHRLVQGFPAADAADTRTAAMPRADRIQEVEAEQQRARSRHAARVQTDEQRQQSALQVGAGLRRTAPETFTPEEPHNLNPQDEVEIW